MMISRRRFIVQCGMLAASAAVMAHSRASATDEAAFRRVMEKAGTEGWSNEPIGRIVELTGLSFTGTPYVAHSLEVRGGERLVVDLRGFDCTTFVESMLALSRCIQLGLSTFGSFRDQLQRIRYRGGVIQGYPSRLHYFVDWVDDNAVKGIVRDVTKDLGGIPYVKAIDFMSTHTSAYRQLADPENLRLIKAREDEINARRHFYLPVEEIPAAAQHMQPGDIVGVVTAETGIDVSHVGIAVMAGGELKFLHAPLSGGKVEVSQGALAGYLSARPGRTGAIVARPLNAKQQE